MQCIVKESDIFIRLCEINIILYKMNNWEMEFWGLQELNNNNYFCNFQVFCNYVTLNCFYKVIRSDQSLSRVQLFATPWITARQASLPITNSREFTQTQFHRVSDTIQPFHPVSSPSPPAPNPSQHQSLFQWVNSLHEVAKVLEFQL